MKNREKHLKRKYGKLLESMSAYYHHLDLRRFDEMDDEIFAYVMKPVKGVNMLDLNETDISNESIKLMTTLEYVNELRVKGCHLLDDDCIEYLNQLTSLVFLHAKGTGITIDGLLHLKLPNLRELMFSADDADNLEEKMMRLKANLPGCEFVVNSKPYSFPENDSF